LFVSNILKKSRLFNVSQLFCERCMYRNPVVSIRPAKSTQGYSTTESSQPEGIRSESFKKMRANQPRRRHAAVGYFSDTLAPHCVRCSAGASR
jgi:predicted O-linked N-acetylglucosamine transferase (SPINDLY family)